MSDEEPLELGEPDSLEGTWYKELEGLRDFRNFIFEGCFSIEVNANDLFHYACADSITVYSDDLDIFWMVRKKFGREGEVAFMSLCAGMYEEYDEAPEPLDEYFTRGIMDKDRYEEAKKWLDSIRCECWKGRGISNPEHYHDKTCMFGWKVHRPMYDEPPKGECIARYW